MGVKITSPFEIKILRIHEAEIKTTGDSPDGKRHKPYSSLKFTYTMNILTA
jgi:hypothetical protein